MTFVHRTLHFHFVLDFANLVACPGEGAFFLLAFDLLNNLQENVSDSNTSVLHPLFLVTKCLRVPTRTAPSAFRV